MLYRRRHSNDRVRGIWLCVCKCVCVVCRLLREDCTMLYRRRHSNNRVRGIRLGGGGMNMQGFLGEDCIMLYKRRHSNDTG